MEQIKDKFLTVILIIIILCAIGGFVYVGYNYMKEDKSNIATVEEQTTNLDNIEQSKESLQIEDEASGERKIEVVEKKDKSVTDANLVNIENTNVNAPEILDTYSIKKYNEDGFIKTESRGNQIKTNKYKLRYNYNHRNYDVEFIVPKNWYPEHYSFTDKIQFVQAKEKIENQQPMCALIYEMEINQGTSYDDALGLLANEISKTVLEQGTIYETVNWNNEEIEIDGEMYKVLTYQHNAGKYYKTQCYTVIRIKDEIMYILTVTMPLESVNDENIELKNSILKSLKIVE